ncbi:hypothetical protein T03_16040 [Trichinella britovi]|uniref:Uncharacterized protein n=1 Tax=Trichinella britovi TaxID=45882 RepID=A0A0V1CGI8_TRIBR|nr:hypothetical protein T03_16040 [Trichinella britovi]
MVGIISSTKKLTPGYFKPGVAKVVDIDPLGSMGLSKGSIKA